MTRPALCGPPPPRCVGTGGLTNKQIAARLLLSPRTVGTHLYHVFPKLGITSRAGLRDALTALEQGD